jgi:hypothetical protein
LSPSPTASDDSVAALAAGVADDPDGGPPWAVMFALIAIAAFGAGGWFMRRRSDGIKGG